MYKMHENGMITTAYGHVINSPQIPRWTKHLTVIVGSPQCIHTMPQDWCTFFKHQLQVRQECQELANKYKRQVRLFIEDWPAIVFEYEPIRKRPKTDRTQHGRS